MGEMEKTERRKQSQEEMLAEVLQQGDALTRKQKLKVVWKLSIPAILAQLTSIVMQYIDTAMVGNLGPNASAAIGLVGSSTWLMGGLCFSLCVGFSVQVAQAVGGGKLQEARIILKHALLSGFAFSSLLALIGVVISGGLPGWLGAEEEIQRDASRYFLVFAAFLPAMQLNRLAGAMLQSSGNMKVPSILNSLMCGLDVLFNLILIPRLGVLGASLGTAFSEVVICLCMLSFVCLRSPVLNIRQKEACPFSGYILRRAVKIGLPTAIERVAMNSAQIVMTRMIAPLGTISIAAHSFAITGESLCYMPGFGIGSAASTLVGQCIGAENKKLAKSFADLSILVGVVVMSAAGIIMFVCCPYAFMLLTPSRPARELAARVLRIELFSEPLYAVSIVASGALQGAGDTLVPSILNLASIWCVRLTLARLLVGQWGLRGVWFAMGVELCVRGVLMLLREQFGVLRTKDEA